MHHDTAGPALLGRFGGELLGPADDGYEPARRVFNGAVDRRPALIARCARVDDVIAALAYARERDLPVGVRGGGHSAAGHGVVDGGLVLDLRPMRAVRVDPARRRALVEGGATWAELDRATQAHGLAVTGGRNSTTGVAGVTLGGGSGWLERALGPSCDHLVAAEVVTADGRLLAVDDHEDPELLWALRGGGGNFGVVTRLELCLHPVGPTVLAGQLLHPRDRAGELLALVRDLMAAAPDVLGLGCALAATPDLPFVPEPVRGRPLAGITLCWSGGLAAGERALAPLRAFGPPAMDGIRPMPYVDAQRLLDPLVPPGRRYCCTGEYLRELPDAAIAALVEQASRAPSAGIDLVVVPQGGALARPAPVPAAFDGHQRQAACNTQILIGWDDPADDRREAAWVGAVRAALAPWSAGSGYLNFLGDEGPDRVRAAFSPTTWDRLRQVKRRYDPDNLFRHNHNIPPN